MISADDLLFSYRWGVDTFEKLSSDVPCERFTEQPVDAINHPAWLLGHVSNYNGVIVALLRGDSFDDPWEMPCGKNSSPVAERSAYPSKEEILGRWRTGADAAAEAIAGAASGAWSGAFAHPTWGKQFQAVAPAVVFLGTTHLALHLGQLSGWRRAAGLPRV